MFTFRSIWTVQQFFLSFWSKLVRRLAVTKLWHLPYRNYIHFMGHFQGLKSISTIDWQAGSCTVVARFLVTSIQMKQTEVWSWIQAMNWHFAAVWLELSIWSPRRYQCRWRMLKKQNKPVGEIAKTICYTLEKRKYPDELNELRPKWMISESFPLLPSSWIRLFPMDETKINFRIIGRQKCGDGEEHIILQSTISLSNMLEEVLCHGHIWP